MWNRYHQIRLSRMSNPWTKILVKKKYIYLLKRKISSKVYFEEIKSKNNKTHNETISSQADLELQSSNEVIEEIRSVGLKPLNQNHRGSSQSAWSSQPAPLLRSGVPPPLNLQIIDFWQQKDKIIQNAGFKIFKK